VPNDDGTIAHAQLSFGNGMLMIGSLPDTKFSTYVVVSDADMLYERVKAVGAEIMREIEDEEYSGAASPAAIWTGISGVLAPMIRGDAEPVWGLPVSRDKSILSAVVWRVFRFPSSDAVGNRSGALTGFPCPGGNRARLHQTRTAVKAADGSVVCPSWHWRGLATQTRTRGENIPGLSATQGAAMTQPPSGSSRFVS
jgi:hypothetical protein